MTTTLPQLRMRVATRADATRIAEIHMAAFGPYAMLHAQFPSPRIREKLLVSVENKALADIDDPKTTVLVVSSSGEDNADSVIDFAKWLHPVHPSDHYVQSPWAWPDGTDLDTLGAWTARAAEAESRAVPDARCYRLSFIGTDPTYSHRGTGRLLLQWGVQQSNSSGCPVYLESTVEAAPFYKKKTASLLAKA
ncbi:hypothetical protein HJFPF1_09762 [Paramyrothecium foliicola]|nr:hypothetical protein HJFPF1_09762 [Paramyrothecium foliicola]